MSTTDWPAGRQLGLLWGLVALTLVALSPLASSLAAGLPACPVKAALDLPCPACGSTRAALALAGGDFAAALAANPLAAIGWLALVGGGLSAALAAAVGRPIREPRWRASLVVRVGIVAALLANWIYLLQAGV